MVLLATPEEKQMLKCESSLLGFSCTDDFLSKERSVCVNLLMDFQIVKKLFKKSI